MYKNILNAKCKYKIPQLYDNLYLSIDENYIINKFKVFHTLTYL